MNIFDLSKLNKYQKGMIIASLIFLISMIEFLFNSRVRISESYVEEPEIIIDIPKDIEIKDTNGNVFYVNLFSLVMFIAISIALYKIVWGMLDD